MAKLSQVRRQQKRERLVELKREKRQELKKRAANMALSEEDRQEARVALNKMKKNSAPVRLRGRCLFTGRSRGYMRKFKISRLAFREMASQGLIPGVTKSSW